MTAEASEYESRIRRLAAEAREARRRRPGDGTVEADGGAGIAGPVAADDEPEECGTAVARDGLGPVVALYVEARTAEGGSRLSEEELSLLHRATNDWLAVYAACHGVAFDPDFTVREAAAVLIDTHDVRETAALLTGVPDRSGRNPPA